jgi:hypothetical protein
VAAGGAAVSSVEDLLNMGEDDFEVELAIAFLAIWFNAKFRGSKTSWTTVATLVILASSGAYLLWLLLQIA